MEKDYSTEHIANNQVQFYYDKIIQKVSEEIQHQYNTEKYRGLGQEAMYVLLAMFERYKIQFYSAVSLTYRHTNNPTNQYVYLDISSVETIIRSCYEIFLLFQYIYMQPEVIGEIENPGASVENNIYPDIIQFKVLLYKYEGYRQSFYGLSTIPEERQMVKEICDKYETQIKENEVFKLLDESQKRQILKSWKPSWNKIASKTTLSEWNSKNMYNHLCQNSHNSYTVLIKLMKQYAEFGADDMDAMLMQLYEFTSLLINDYVRLFDIKHERFSQDEIALLNEFMYFARKNPKDVL